MNTILSLYCKNIAGLKIFLLPLTFTFPKTRDGFLLGCFLHPPPPISFIRPLSRLGLILLSLKLIPTYHYSPPIPNTFSHSFSYQLIRALFTIILISAKQSVFDLGSLRPLRTNNEKELSGIMVCENYSGKQGKER